MEDVAMKTLRIAGLTTLAALAATHCFAQELSWRPASETPAFQRVAAPAAAPVTLSRPIPLSNTSDYPNATVPAVLLERPTPLFRAKNTDQDDVPRLLPVGPAAPAATQPGTAKPMTQSEALGMPRIVDTFTSPAPSVIYSNVDSSSGVGTVLGRRYLGANAGGETIVNVPCDTGGDCGSSCVTDCGPCWGRRLREWAGCCDDPCCLPRSHAWLRGEFLLWNISGQHTPPLVTGENAPIRAPDAAGTLPLSPILAGDNDMFDSVRSGGRFAMGFWLPRRSCWGFDGSVFMLGRRSNSFQANSDSNGNPVLARPFFQPAFGGVAAGEAAELVAFPGLLAGGVSIDSSTRLWGVDANLRRKLCCGPRWWLDGFVGYRHIDLSDTIDINESLTVIAPGQERRGFLVNDHFATRNSFNGIQAGFEGELKILRRWFIAGNIKLGVGNMHELLNIDGSTAFLIPGQATQFGRGGLFALASNIGRHENNEFAFAPEVGLKIGFDINDHWRVYAGYNLLYLSRVARAGEQIDRVVNFVGMAPEPGNLNPPVVSPARPAVLFRQSDFWAQGGQFGVEYHW
jgi:hypothetical protein